VADWVAISSLATAGGTLALAGTTYASVRSANRAARAAEVSMLAQLRAQLLGWLLNGADSLVGRQQLVEKLGFWQGAWRDEDNPDGDFRIDILHGDYEGGQRVITRFGCLREDDGSWSVSAARHWQIDRSDPR
jgi:hypothetical protein